MRTEQDIQSNLALYRAYAERHKARAVSGCGGDLEECGKELRNMLEWRLRADTLEWVLQESDPEHLKRVHG